MIGFIRYLFGYIDVDVSGEKTERVINSCNAAGIRIWNVYKRGETIRFRIKMKDYKKLRHIRKQGDGKFKIRIYKKYGLPLLRKRVFTRFGVCAGLVLMLLVNLFLSQFIWSIDVVGNDSISTESIVSACKKQGIDVGTYSKGIDTYNSAQKIALDFKQIAWISLNIEGSKLTVNVSEANYSEIFEKTPKNIIAARNGVIKELEVVTGNKTAAVGETVSKGDLLVSGVIDNGVSTHFVSSEGVVIAETLRRFETSIDKKFEYITPVYKNTDRVVFEFFGIKAPLYLNKPENVYNSYYENTNARLFGCELPVGVAKRKFILGDKTIKQLTKEEAENYSIYKFSEELKSDSVNNVQSYSVDTVENDKFYKITITAVCLENICEFQPINLTDD